MKILRRVLKKQKRYIYKQVHQKKINSIHDDEVTKEKELELIEKDGEKEIAGITSSIKSPIKQLIQTGSGQKIEALQQCTTKNIEALINDDVGYTTKVRYAEDGSVWVEPELERVLRLSEKERLRELQKRLKDKPFKLNIQLWNEETDTPTDEGKIVIKIHKTGTWNTDRAVGKTGYSRQDLLRKRDMILVKLLGADGTTEQQLATWKIQNRSMVKIANMIVQNGYAGEIQPPSTRWEMWTAILKEKGQEVVAFNEYRDQIESVPLSTIEAIKNTLDMWDFSEKSEVILEELAKMSPKDVEALHHDVLQIQDFYKEEHIQCTIKSGTATMTQELSENPHGGMWFKLLLIMAHENGENIPPGVLQHLYENSEKITHLSGAEIPDTDALTAAQKNLPESEKRLIREKQYEHFMVANLRASLLMTLYEKEEEHGAEFERFFRVFYPNDQEIFSYRYDIGHGESLYNFYKQTQSLVKKADALNTPVNTLQTLFYEKDDTIGHIVCTDDFDIALFTAYKSDLDQVPDEDCHGSYTTESHAHSCIEGFYTHQKKIKTLYKNNINRLIRLAIIDQLREGELTHEATAEVSEDDMFGEEIQRFGREPYGRAVQQVLQNQYEQSWPGEKTAQEECKKLCLELFAQGGFEKRRQEYKAADQETRAVLDRLMHRSELYPAGITELLKGLQTQPEFLALSYDEIGQKRETHPNDPNWKTRYLDDQKILAYKKVPDATMLLSHYDYECACNKIIPTETLAELKKQPNKLLNHVLSDPILRKYLLPRYRNAEQHKTSANIATLNRYLKENRDLFERLIEQRSPENDEVIALLLINAGAQSPLRVEMIKDDFLDFAKHCLQRAPNASESANKESIIEQILNLYKKIPDNLRIFLGFESGKTITERIEKLEPENKVLGKDPLIKELTHNAYADIIADISAFEITDTNRNKFEMFIKSSLGKKIFDFTIKNPKAVTNNWDEIQNIYPKFFEDNLTVLFDYTMKEDPDRAVKKIINPWSPEKVLQHFRNSVFMGKYPSNSKIYIALIQKIGADSILKLIPDALVFRIYAEQKSTLTEKLNETDAFFLKLRVALSEDNNWQPEELVEYVYGEESEAIELNILRDRSLAEKYLRFFPHAHDSVPTNNQLLLNIATDHADSFIRYFPHLKYANSITGYENMLKEAASKSAEKFFRRFPHQQHTNIPGYRSALISSGKSEKAFLKTFSHAEHFQSPGYEETLKNAAQNSPTIFLKKFPHRQLHNKLSYYPELLTQVFSQISGMNNVTAAEIKAACKLQSEPAFENQDILSEFCKPDTYPNNTILWWIRNPERQALLRDLQFFHPKTLELYKPSPLFDYEKYKGLKTYTATERKHLITCAKKVWNEIYRHKINYKYNSPINFILSIAENKQKEALYDEISPLYNVQYDDKYKMKELHKHDQQWMTELPSALLESVLTYMQEAETDKHPLPKHHEFLITFDGWLEAEKIDQTDEEIMKIKRKEYDQGFSKWRERKKFLDFVELTNYQLQTQAEVDIIKRLAKTQNTDEGAQLFKYMVSCLAPEYTPAELLPVYEVYTKRFGLAQLPLVFRYCVELMNGTINPEITNIIDQAGEKGIDQLKTVVLQNKQNLINKEEAIEPSKLSNLELESYRYLTRFDSSSWSRGYNFQALIQALYQGIKTQEIAPVSPEYHTQEIQLRATPKNVDFEVFLVPYKKLTAMIDYGLKHKQFENYRAEVGSILGTDKTHKQAALDQMTQQQATLEQLTTRSSDQESTLKQLVSSIPQLRKQILKSDTLTRKIEKTKGPSELVVVLSQAKYQTAEMKQLIQSLIIWQYIEQYPNMEEEISRIVAEPKLLIENVQTLSEMINQRLKNELLEDKSVGAHQEESLFPELENKQRGYLRQMLNTNTLKDIQKAVSLQKGELLTDSFVIQPSRAMMGECSGYIGDACWTTNEQILKNNPDMTPYVLIKERATNPELIGAGLLFERSINNGQDTVMVIRGFNPQSKVLSDISADSFCENLLAYAESVAQKRGCKYVIAPLGQGVISNRPEVTSYFVNLAQKRSNQSKTIGKKIALDEALNFNGYDITNNCVVISEVPSF